MQPSKRPIELAGNDAPARPGFILDYQTVVGSVSNHVFQGDQTAFLTDTLYCDGVTVIEGGAVLKATNGTAELRINGALVCATGPYRPAVFTAKDDDSVGERIDGSTGNPEAGGDYGQAALCYSYPAAPLVLHDVRIQYKTYGLYLIASGAHVVRHCQFANVAVPLLAFGGSLQLQNLLIQDARFMAIDANATVSAENLTVHRANELVHMGYLSLTNSLLVAVTNWGAAFTSFNNATNNDESLFETAGAGAHYLPTNSIYCHAGTPNIDTNLLAELQQRTVHPPRVFQNETISADTVLGPYVQRDLSGLSLGYHYDVLDYLFGGVSAEANLTFTAGTAVGWFRTTEGWQHAGHGIHLADGKTATFNGTASQPIYWVRRNTVQEGIAGLWEGHYGPGGITGWADSTANAPTVQARFLRCAMLGWETSHFRDDYGWIRVRAQDCEFFGGGVGGYASSLALTNSACSIAPGWTLKPARSILSVFCATAPSMGAASRLTAGLTRRR